MLINVSRFTDVQAQVFDLVRGEVATYKNAIDMHSRAYGRGEPNPFLSKLEATFRAEFADSGAEWDLVLDGLRQANFSLETLITNSRTGRRDSMPLRYVAIGGDLLSRGLTLEGLSTSYFYRRTQAADTLMQMGRWFGYRSGYEDLCRIWLTEEMAHAFQHALASLDDLRVDIGEMARQQLTPRQFGISVRLHPDALAITARNKMKASQVQQGKSVVSLRGTVIETARLHGDVGVLGKNLEVTRVCSTSAPTSWRRPRPAPGGSSIEGSTRSWSEVSSAISKCSRTGATSCSKVRPFPTSCAEPQPRTCSFGTSPSCQGRASARDRSTFPAYPGRGSPRLE
jgi:hypothetical protein